MNTLHVGFSDNLKRINVQFYPLMSFINSYFLPVNGLLFLVNTKLTRMAIFTLS